MKTASFILWLICICLALSCRTVKDTTNTKTSNDTTRNEKETIEHFTSKDSSYSPTILTPDAVHDTVVINYDEFCDSLRNGGKPVLTVTTKQGDHTSQTTLDSRNNTLVHEMSNWKLKYDSLLTIHQKDSTVYKKEKETNIKQTSETDNERVRTNDVYKYLCFAEAIIILILLAAGRLNKK